MEAARGERGTKRTAPQLVQDSGFLEDNARLTQCAVVMRTGLQQVATATPLLEDSLERADKDFAPHPSPAHALDQLLTKYEVGGMLQPPRKKGATEAVAPVTGCW